MNNKFILFEGNYINSDCIQYFKINSIKLTIYLRDSEYIYKHYETEDLAKSALFFLKEKLGLNVHEE